VRFRVQNRELRCRCSRGQELIQLYRVIISFVEKQSVTFNRETIQENDLCKLKPLSLHFLSFFLSFLPSKFQPCVPSASGWLHVWAAVSPTASDTCWHCILRVKCRAAAAMLERKKETKSALYTSLPRAITYGQKMGIKGGTAHISVWLSRLS
jgi:hypothetical protein